jgi:predicted transcriptional regulator
MRSRDPWVRASRATEEMERHLVAIARLADARAIAIRELLDRGLTRAEIARRLGVTPAVVTKILKRPVTCDPASGNEGNEVGSSKGGRAR